MTTVCNWNIKTVLQLKPFFFNEASDRNPLSSRDSSDLDLSDSNGKVLLTTWTAFYYSLGLLTLKGGGGG